jgi:hypothetical protein
MLKDIPTLVIIEFQELSDLTAGRVIADGGIGLDVLCFPNIVF